MRTPSERSRWPALATAGERASRRSSGRGKAGGGLDEVGGGGMGSCWRGLRDGKGEVRSWLRGAGSSATSCCCSHEVFPRGRRRAGTKARAAAREHDDGLPDNDDKGDDERTHSQCCPQVRSPCVPTGRASRSQVEVAATDAERPANSLPDPPRPPSISTLEAPAPTTAADPSPRPDGPSSSPVRRWRCQLARLRVPDADVQVECFVHPRSQPGPRLRSHARPDAAAAAHALAARLPRARLAPVILPLAPALDTRPRHPLAAARGRCLLPASLRPAASPSIRGRRRRRARQQGRTRPAAGPPSGRRQGHAEPPLGHARPGERGRDRAVGDVWRGRGARGVARGGRGCAAGQDQGDGGGWRWGTGDKWGGHVGGLRDCSSDGGGRRARRPRRRSRTRARSAVACESGPAVVARRPSTR